MKIGASTRFALFSLVLLIAPAAAQVQAVVVPVDGSTVAVVGQVEPTGSAYPAIIEVSDFAGLLVLDVVQVEADGSFVTFVHPDALSKPDGDADLHVWPPTPTGYEMMGAMIVAPAPGESGDDPPPAESETVGKEREKKVAEITGGVVDNTNISTPTGSTDIDVSKPGPPPVYITVSGPGKSGQKLEAWKTHLSKMKDLMDGKAKYKDLPKKGQPVPAGQIEVYLEQGTPQDVIDAAVAKFGQDHVHIFTR